MPAKFESLASYNSEVARGIVHTQEWKARMIYLQAEFDQWVVSTAPFGTTTIISYPPRVGCLHDFDTNITPPFCRKCGEPYRPPFNNDVTSPPMKVTS